MADLLPGATGFGWGDDGVVGTEDIDMLAAALRADVADLEVYARVLIRALVDALPTDMVTVELERTWGDRLAGRPGAVSLLRIQTSSGDLELSSRPGRAPRATIAYRLRDEVVARRDVSVTEWALLLTHELRSRASDSAAVRAALARLLGG